MFNLNQALAAWRQQMAAGGITSAEVLDELEDEVAEPPTPRPVRRQSKVKRSY